MPVHRTEEHNAVLCTSSKVLSSNKDIRTAAFSLEDLHTQANTNLAVVIDNQNDLSQRLDMILSAVNKLALAKASENDALSTPAVVVVQRFGDHQGPHKTRPNRHLESSRWKLSPAWTVLGITGKGIPTSRQYDNHYYASFKILEPVTSWLTGYYLRVSINLRNPRASPLGFQFRNGTRFDICRVVDSHHPFLEACARGDVAEVRSFLDSGAGRTTDRDEKNWTPLAHAIKGGAYDVVEELIKYHADIDDTFGLHETSPLQWAVCVEDLDITRLLLQRGASQDYINMRIWNTVFFCWARLQSGKPCLLGFLNLLAEDSELQLNIVDGRHWTVLDRVATVGTAPEIRRLIEPGADPHKRAFTLRWTSLQQAVFAGNAETFEELFPRYEKAVEMTDARGWTLLHIAASAGHQTLVRRLLELGSESEALSYATDKPSLLARMPEILHGRRCTPREVAAAQGIGREQEYLETLEWVQEVDGGGEEFWEAQEQPEEGCFT